MRTKKIDGELYYLVKWKNFPPSNNTWEPAEHIQLEEKPKKKLKNKKAKKKNTIVSIKPEPKKRGRPIKISNNEIDIKPKSRQEDKENRFNEENLQSNSVSDMVEESLELN